MKILITSPFRVWPSSFGGAVRTLSIARALGDIGHDVSLLAADPVGPPEAIGPSLQWIGYASRGRMGHFVNQNFHQTFSQILENRFNLIISSFPFQSFMTVGPARRASIPIVYDAHNVEADRFRSMGQPVKAILIRWVESYLCQHAHAVTAVSREDQQLFSKYYGVKSILLPNGVDTAKFSPTPPDERLLIRYDLINRKVILYFGSFEYMPNIEALKFLIYEAWPAVLRNEPNARLLVVGRHPPAWASEAPGVIVTGEVDDVAAHVRLANVVAVPLTIGGGTRLKTLEALACGQTVLSTPFGAMGIPHNYENGLILADLKDFGNRLATILVNPPEPCSNAVSRQISLNFDWKDLVSKVDWERLKSHEE